MGGSGGSRCGKTPDAFNSRTQVASERRLRAVSGGRARSTEDPNMERCEGLCPKQDHGPKKAKQSFVAN